MRGAFLKTVVALIVLLGLGGYVYWSDKHDTAKPKDEKAKVFTFDKAKVTGIRLQPLMGQEVVLAKQAEGWRLGDKAELPASQPEVETLVGGIAALEAGDTISDTPTDLKQYGLDPPHSAASVTVEGLAQPLVVQLGSKTFDGASVYAKRPNEKAVFVIPAFLQGALEKKPFDLRDRDLLHLDREKVKSIEVTGPEGSYTLEKAGKDEWAIVKPLKSRAGRWPVDTLLGALEGLRMDSVASEEATDLKPFGLDQPARVVTLTLEDGSHRRLEIGSATADKKYNAREALSKMVAVVPPAIVDDLAKGLPNLRAKRLMEVSAYDVDGIEGKLADGARTYARSGEKGADGAEAYKWKRTAPDAKDLDTAKVEDVIFKLSGLEAQEFVDAPGGPDKYGLDAPALDLKLTLGKDKPAVTVTIGKKDGAAYARRAGDDAILKLDPAKVDEALAALKAL
jgi:Domain of unknown function (DUF4340)